MDIVFEAIAEDRPGPKWRSVYDRQHGTIVQAKIHAVAGGQTAGDWF